MKKWYKLDNIGKFYAATTNNKIPKVYRYSAKLYEDVDEVVLQQAVNRTVEIYSNFNVNLKKGFFWYYLDESSKVCQVTKENLPICFKLYNNSFDLLYRVSYYKKKINFEMSHILSDGRGSVEFFKLLVTNYVNIKYNLKLDTSKDNNSFLDKTEDSFNKYYEKTKLPKNKKQPHYIYKGKKYRNQIRFFECHMDVKKVLDLAHKYNTTLTGLLIAALIYSFKDELSISDMKKCIRIDVPVDLRNYFKSTSAMNFFGLTKISYKFKSKEDKLEDIVKEVNKQLKDNLTREKLLERVNMMVFFERNWFSKCFPIFIKELAIKIGDKLTCQASTTSMSNIGIVKLDPKVEERVEYFSAFISTNTFQFTTCTVKDDFCIGISSCFVNNNIIKNFCRFFSLNDIKMRIDVSEVAK